jgi:hypothetical protein
MTALSIERRIRTLRRRPNTDGSSLPKLVAWHEWQADRARQELELAKATSIWSLSSGR